jgi:hypothetical protein
MTWVPPGDESNEFLAFPGSGGGENDDLGLAPHALHPWIAPTKSGPFQPVPGISREYLFRSAPHWNANPR